MRLTGVIAVLLAGLCACAASPAESPSRALRIDEAQVVLDFGSEPPADERAGWEPVSLPDRWRERRPHASGLAWYRLTEPGPIPPGETWAVYLPHVCMNAAARVNGAPIGSGGRFTEPVARNFNRPLYFAFPSDLLDRAANTIEIRLASNAPLCGELGAVWVGPDEELRPSFERALWLRTTMAQVATVLCLVTMALSGALWLGNRRDAVYGWLALATALWSVASLNYWVRDVPVPTWTWERAMHTAMDGFMLALVVWAHRYVGVRRPRVERGLAGAAAVALAVGWLVPRARFYPAANLVHAALLPGAVYGTLLVLLHALRSRPIEALIYVPAGVAALAFAVHDLLLQFEMTAPGAPYLLPYIVPLILVSFGSTIVLRFVSALRSAETLNRELEQRVLDKHRELDRSFEERRALAGQKLLAEERERLVREMHDGLAGQLVSVLALVEGDPEADPRIAGAVRAALDDMRLVIDSLDPALQTLTGALGAARARFEPALAESGVALEWRAGDLPATPWLSPQDYLQVLRIVQEALVNVVRHAGATRVAVRSGRGEDEQGRAGIRIEVTDDGRGLDPAATKRPRGRGLRHMRERAARLSGSLRVESADAATGTGTRVVLWLPPEPPEPPGPAGEEHTPGG